MMKQWDLGNNKFWGKVKKDKLEAVSYTHLRAHETPEHLVCRLLLRNVLPDSLTATSGDVALMKVRLIASWLSLIHI